MNCSQTQQDLGVYVLGMLDPDERDAVRRHVADCPFCRTELAELEELPAILGKLLPADLAALRADAVTTPAPPREGLSRLLARAERLRRRRWGWLALAAAVLIFALAGVTTFMIIRPVPGPSPQPSMSWAATDQTSGVRAAAEMSQQPGGAEIRLDLHGVPAGTVCRLIVRSTDGTSTTAGSWQADYAGTAQVTLSTSVDLNKIAALTISDRAGHRLLRLSR
ncbi:anti-sigma factor [Microlunatus soli]|uniref:Putative zinc-finger n=1 Tax=Microlunatus soli TaxID=630515 RepID=A0A1H2A442_9ACTN|nr:zf-HC2 domain-containing protein [Microlunatus soli]SDT40680.1 Putative zinc-finger [Microlunatus soli]